VEKATTTPPVPEAASRTAAATSNATGVDVERSSGACATRVDPRRVRSYGGRKTGREAGAEGALAFLFVVTRGALLGVDAGAARSVALPPDDAVETGRGVSTTVRPLATDVVGRDVAGRVGFAVTRAVVPGGSGVGVTGVEDAVLEDAASDESLAVACAGRRA
jgi:hypothetical protein